LRKIDEIVDMVKRNPLLDGITLSGGEPFEQASALAELASEVKKLKLNVVAYTGYTYEELSAPEANDDWKKLLDQVDILVDGPFIQAKKSLMLKFKGSANQRLIDLNKTRRCNEIVLWE
jgi:anaerobic ribonucleoside-triphosphate reductase activating protein